MCRCGQSCVHIQHWLHDCTIWLSFTFTLDTVCVHKQEQYIFIHDAILESVTCGDTQIETNNLRVAMHKLKERSQSGGNGYNDQFSVSYMQTQCISPHLLYHWMYC